MFFLILKLAKARLAKPTKFITAKMIVQLEDVFQTNSLSRSPAVPTVIRTKPLSLMEFRKLTSYAPPNKKP